MAEAAGLRRIDIGDLADLERGRPHHPRASGHEGHDDRQDHVLRAGAEDRHHGQRHDDQRERHEDIHDALEDEVEQAAEIGAGNAQYEAEEAADGRGSKAHKQRRAGAVNDTGIDIAPEHVGAEDEIPVRRRQHILVGIQQRIVRGHHIGEDRHQDHEHYDNGPGDADRLFAGGFAQFDMPGLEGRRLLEHGYRKAALGNSRHRRNPPSCSGCAGRAPRRGYRPRD